MSDPRARAAALLGRARKIVAFTGAGVSAESGIPTDRGEGGMWTQYDPAKYADYDYFMRDSTYYWSFFKDVRYRTLVASSPNRAHAAIARLEQLGKLDTVITQNIDGLHQAAGNTHVIELHGNTRIIACLDCHVEYDFEVVRAQVETELPPRCRACGGVLKPKVVFFGEALPSGAMDDAATAVTSADLMLVVGSTLAVYPAASLPLAAKRAGAALVIVNVGETAMDEIADVRIDAKAGDVLPDLVARGEAARAADD
jgi:NAD-dependent deacetylase